MTVSTNLMKLICSQEENATILLAEGLRVQVLSSFRDLPRCQKHQFAAFLADSQMLVVWDDDPYHLIERASSLERQLLRINWGHGLDDDGKDDVVVTEKPVDADSQDPEAAGDKVRPTRIQSSVMVSATITLLIATLGLGWRQLANELMVDPRFGVGRLAILVYTPIQVFLSLVCAPVKWGF